MVPRDGERLDKPKKELLFDNTGLETGEISCHRRFRQELVKNVKRTGKVKVRSWDFVFDKRMEHMDDM